MLKLDQAGAAGTCPSCGALQARGARFCWSCGKEVKLPGGEQPTAAKPAAKPAPKAKPIKPGRKPRAKRSS
jgi:predicted amidophosphoribosyltransferase